MRLLQRCYDWVMGLAARGRAWRFAAVCTIASVLGGMFGYAIGLFLYDAVGRPLLVPFASYWTQSTPSPW